MNTQLFFDKAIYYHYENVDLDIALKLYNEMIKYNDYHGYLGCRYFILL